MACVPEPKNKNGRIPPYIEMRYGKYMIAFYYPDNKIKEIEWFAMIGKQVVTSGKCLSAHWPQAAYTKINAARRANGTSNGE